MKIVQSVYLTTFGDMVYYVKKNHCMNCQKVVQALYNYLGLVHCVASEASVNSQKVVHALYNLLSFHPLMKLIWT